MSTEDSTPNQRKEIMGRWLKPVGVVVLVLVVLLAGWQLFIQPKLGDDESSPETTAIEENDSESIPTPTEEEIEALVVQFESQDKDIFLEAWVSNLEELLEEEVIREELMVPEGSTVMPSDLLWSDDYDGWTIDIAIEAPGHDPVTRTMVLKYFEGLWRISKEVK